MELSAHERLRARVWVQTRLETVARARTLRKPVFCNEKQRPPHPPHTLTRACMHARTHTQMDLLPPSLPHARTHAPTHAPTHAQMEVWALMTQRRLLRRHRALRLRRYDFTL